MSTLFISAPGALNQNENLRRQVVIADAQLRVAHSAPLLSSAKVPEPALTKSAEATAVIEILPKQHHVIVVGAGISGLRTASVLQRHGVSVTILEGRPDRIGGRILTSRQPGRSARDIGAAWMHETSQNKLVHLIPRLGIEYYFDDGTPLYYTRDGRAGAQFKAKKVADEFADYCDWFYREHPDAPDRSVKEFVHEFVNKHPLLSSTERKWAPQATREVELWIGTSIEAASSKHLSYFVTERNLYMKGGYDKIVEWTAKPLLRNPETIRLGEVVKDITWGSEDGSIVVHSTNDNKENTYCADAIVVTVPLGVLRRSMITFNPPLPAAIQTGISNFSYGALGKVFVQFSDIFWPKDNDQFIYYPSPLPPDTPVDETSILSYATVTSNLWIMSGTKELCIQIAEPLTQRVEAMSDPEVLYAFFEPLFKLLRTEPYKDLPELLNIETTHWTQDPLAGFGSYSVEKTGDDSGFLMDALKQNRGSRLQFAGEHCTVVGNGCVHGAFETGEIAARNLLATLGVEYDGRDSRSTSPEI
ncbi:flavin-containing amine oxidase-like protein [Xylogone sp. PMI_703]|nr:flavin-containing amine oxidase-like protein [Xylogone sp. PMI_703]